MSLSFSNRLRHFQLGTSERDTLRHTANLVLPELDTVLGRFYDFALAEPEIAGFFEGAASVSHARQAQKKHWQMLLSADFSDDYRASCNRIGHVHYKIQLPFAYYLSSYARATSEIQSVVVNAVLGQPEADANTGDLVQMLGVLSRAFQLDVELVIDAYFAAQEEERQAEQNGERQIAMDYLSAGIKRLANRDFSQTIPGPQESDFPEGFDELREGYNAAVHNLRQTMTVIASTVDDLDGFAAEISNGTGDLARRTENQSASLEETAAALQMVTEGVKETADDTASADIAVAEASLGAENGGKVVVEVISAMEEIKSSSEEMAGKVKVIDDIAFQTNLLALNAGVEAARAGDAGRGFAVVATEVRALAGRASVAAKEIRELISRSAGHVEVGTSQVGKAGEALEKIVGDVGIVAGLVSKISNSTNDQSLSLADVNASTGQLDSVTQQNAAMAEETNAASLGVKQASGQLSELIRSFRFNARNATGGSGYTQSQSQRERSAG